MVKKKAGSGGGGGGGGGGGMGGGGMGGGGMGGGGGYRARRLQRGRRQFMTGARGRTSPHNVANKARHPHDARGRTTPNKARQLAANQRAHQRRLDMKRRFLAKRKERLQNHIMQRDLILKSRKWRTGDRGAADLKEIQEKIRRELGRKLSQHASDPGDDDDDDPNDPNGGSDPNDPNGGSDPNDPNGGFDPNDPNGGSDPNDPNGGSDPNDPNGGSDPNDPNGGGAGMGGDPNDPNYDPNIAMSGPGGGGGYDGGYDPKDEEEMFDGGDMPDYMSFDAGGGIFMRWFIINSMLVSSCL